ncbi:hypothetical protein [Syntrophomonas curvata]
MLDLDFAFLNLNHDEKRGLVYRKYFLDRLGPVFFSPRVEKLIQLSDLNFRGCQISMPLGPGNLSLIEPETRQLMLNRSVDIAREYQLPGLAADRRLKQQLHELSISFPLVFGDNFIKALAVALTARMLSRREIKRVILVGETDYFSDFIGGICAHGIPLSIQTRFPARYEVMAYRLLYEKGYAVSTSVLSPQTWNEGELVFILDPREEGVAVAFPRVCCIRLTNNSCGLAPELEAKLDRNGIVNNLYNLAPIMETCMLAEAGFLSSGGEKIWANGATLEEGQKFLGLQQVGAELGLWDLFLDKAI